MTVALAPQIGVVVRDWLNSNQIVLRGRQTVVIDTGYGRDAQETLRRVRAALGARHPDCVVNTHCHSDHMGGNALLARSFACPIAIPHGEAPLIERWDEQALWLSYADQRCERFAPARTIAPGERLEWGDAQWQAIPAPGHDMNALMFWCETQRILISGDALWENGFGVLLPDALREARLHATRSTLEAIGALKPRIVIPGHGAPFTDVAAALDRAWRRLEALAADELRMARAVLRTMFVFSLLDRRALPAAGLPDRLASVPLYVDYNTRFFGHTPERLAQWLLDDLVAAGAVIVRDGQLLPRG
ncbi:MAG TPA: MBL fold metallo-hydrolase [Burkholderiales bacterium]|jgi:glyoxylase-like metal-dependent hydrolase (beta-lactamase superfamily II)|nr:MBL fold metallo-hydrolase [Burkholderiales bacterium]